MSSTISISLASSSSSPDNKKGKIVKQRSSSSSSTTSAFKRLCRKLSPKQSPRTSTSSSSEVVDDVITTAPKALDDELIQRVFNYFDENEDGKITASELMSCMSLVGGRVLTLAEAEVVVASSDSDGDGMLGLEDFAKLLEGCEEEEETREAFGMYTAEGTGSITAESLKRMLSRLGQSNSVDNCRAMIRKFDLNGDGVLNFEEFRVMMH